MRQPGKATRGLLVDKPLYPARPSAEECDYGELPLASLRSSFYSHGDEKQADDIARRCLAGISHEADSIVRDCCLTLPIPTKPSPITISFVHSSPNPFSPQSTRLRSNDDCILGLRRGIRSRFKNLPSVRRILWGEI